MYAGNRHHRGMTPQEQELTRNEDQLLFENIDRPLLLLGPRCDSFGPFFSKRRIKVRREYVDIRRVRVARDPESNRDNKNKSVNIRTRI